MNWRWYVMVAVGGALGALARTLAQELAKCTLGDAWPYGTFGVNVIGAFLIGCVLYQPNPTDTPGFHATWFTAGFLGALTTFSAFSYDNYRMLFVKQEYLAGFLNITLSMLLCLAAVGGGIWSARQWWARG